MLTAISAKVIWHWCYELLYYIIDTYTLNTSVTSKRLSIILNISNLLIIKYFWMYWIIIAGKQKYSKAPAENKNSISCAKLFNFIIKSNPAIKILVMSSCQIYARFVSHPLWLDIKMLAISNHRCVTRKTLSNNDSFYTLVLPYETIYHLLLEYLKISRAFWHNLESSCIMYEIHWIITLKR